MHSLYCKSLRKESGSLNLPLPVGSAPADLAEILEVCMIFLAASAEDPFLRSML